MHVIEWTAYNNKKILNTTHKVKSIQQAVLDGRTYLETELKGEGTIKIYKNGELFRIDKKSKRAEYEIFKPKHISLPDRWWQR